MSVLSKFCKYLGISALVLTLAFFPIADIVRVWNVDPQIESIFGIKTAEAVYVRGYYRSNGTYVAPHYRSAPDGIPYNNYSYPGNTNPYTGEVAPGNPNTYLDNYYGNSGSNSYYVPSYGSGSYDWMDFDYTSPTSPGDYWVYDDSKKVYGAQTWSGYYIDPTPYFVFTPSTDNKKVKGYYFLWSTNPNLDPEVGGKFSRKPEFKAPKLKYTGNYYLIVKAVDKAGNTSSTVYGTYGYLKY